MGARTALVALLSALSLPGVRPSPSALGLGTSRRLAPMAQAVRALPADYKWDVLVNTAVYGETPKTFTKRKQVEFLEALAQTVRLQWQWGSTKGGAPPDCTVHRSEARAISDMHNMSQWGPMHRSPQLQVIKSLRASRLSMLSACCTS